MSANEWFRQTWIGITVERLISELHDLFHPPVDPIWDNMAAAEKREENIKRIKKILRYPVDAFAIASDGTRVGIRRAFTNGSADNHGLVQVELTNKARVWINEREAMTLVFLEGDLCIYGPQRRPFLKSRQQVYVWGITEDGTAAHWGHLPS